MSKFTKRLLSLLVVIAMVVAMAPATGIPAVEAKAEATGATALPEGVQAQIDKGAEIAKLNPAEVIQGTTCPMCGATGISFSEGPDATKSHWYFDKTIEHGGWMWNDMTAAQATTCIVLNNANITVASPAFFGLKDGRTLNIMGTGTITSTGANGGSGQYGVFNMTGEATVNLYGGTYSYTGTNVPVVNIVNAASGTVNLYNDAKIDGAGVTRGIVVGANTTLNMYGGTITNGKNVNYGGNIYVNAGTANIYAGTVSNGTAQGSHGSEGGNLAVLGGTANIYGGNFVGGVANNGGNVAFPIWDYNGNKVEGSLNMQGGTFDGGSATANGGNLYTRSDFTIGAAAVLKNGSAASGGNVYIWSAKLTTSGDILDGSATSGGGNVFLHLTASMEVNGGIIGGGTTSGGFGANIRVAGQTVTINDGYFYGAQDGTTAGGKNIYMTSGTLNINGGHFAGDIQADGGSVTLSGAPQILNQITLPDGSVKSAVRGIVAPVMNADNLSEAANIKIHKDVEAGDVIFATSTKAAEITGCFSNNWGGFIIADGDNLVAVKNEPVVQHDCPACGAEDVVWEEYDGTQAYGAVGEGKALNEHVHLYLAKDVTETVGSGNLAVIGAGGSICLDLNSNTLTVDNGRFWLSSGAADDAQLNIIANGGTINYSGCPVIAQNKGNVKVLGGTYNGTDSEYFIQDAARNVLLKDAKINNNISLSSTLGKFILQGATTVGKVELDFVNNNGTQDDTSDDYVQYGKLELASDWIGSATLDMEADQLTNGVVPISQAFFTGDAPEGKLKLASEQELSYFRGMLYIEKETDAQSVVPVEAQQKIMEAERIAAQDPAAVITAPVCPMCGAQVKSWTKLSGGNITTAGHYYIEGDLVNLATDKSSYRVFHVPEGETICVVLLKDANVSWAGPFMIGEANSTFNVMGNGSVESNGTNDGYGKNTIAATNEGMTVNLYGGNYTFSYENGGWGDSVVKVRDGATLNLFGDATIGSATQDREASIRNVAVLEAAINLYGGVIQNGTRRNVTLLDNAEFAMYAGLIKNGYSPATFNKANNRMEGTSGGNIGTEGFSGKGGDANIKIYGGTITGGEAGKGGNIAGGTGNIEIYGGTISNGIADNVLEGASYGGNIYIGGSGTENIIAGGTITGGQAGLGGNIYARRGVTTISGATVSGGTAEFGGDFYVTAILEDATKLIFNGGDYTDADLGIAGYAKFHDATVDTIHCAEGHDVRLYGSTTVETIDVNNTMGALRGMETWSGTANAINFPEGTFVHGTASSDTPGRYVFLQSSTGYNECGGRFTVNGLAVIKDGNLHIGAIAKVGGEEIEWFNTMAAAIAEYTPEDFAAGKYLQVYLNSEIELAGDNYYIDSCGYNVTVSGEGTVYAMDSDNADDFEGYGQWTVAEGAEVTFEDDFVAPDGTRYIVITEGGVTSAHALVMGLGGVIVNTDEAGLYYEAQYKCDKYLAGKIEAYGVYASLKDMPSATMEAGDARTELHTFKLDSNYEVLSKSSYIYGIFKDTRTVAKNAEYGKMKIYANPYIQLIGGKVILADTENVGEKAGEHVYSLYDALKSINDNMSQFADDRAALKQFCTTWADVIAEYNLENLANVQVYTVADPVTWEEINRNAGQTATMTAQERREEALRYMKLMMSFQWTPNVDATHTNTKGGETTVSQELKVGTVYGGTPYVTSTQGNLYAMMEYYDETTGVLDLTDGMDTIRKFSNQCSGSVYWAWQRVAPSAQFDATPTMVPSHGCISLIDVEGGIIVNGKNLNDVNSYSDFGLKGENGKETATDAIINEVGEQALYAAYAKTDIADGLVTYISINGHALMISKEPVVEYKAGGTIDGDKSYLHYLDQNGEYNYNKNTVTVEGVTLIGGHDVKITFKQLMEEGYIPFTFAEFTMGENEESLKSNVTFSVANGDVTVDELAKATVTSNYGVSDVTYEIYKGTEMVDRDLRITYPTLDLHAYSFVLGQKDMMNADMLKFYADGEHTVKISIRIGSGEKIEVFSGALVG